jgi:23S rRNA-/tRNA-specific pseudouridylate synthase
MKIKILICLLILSSTAGVLDAFSQTIIKPNQALKSHETLQIKKIETTSDETVISLSIENRRVDGSFCADKNIFIIYPDGSRIKLAKSIGIPSCPDAYKFKNIGEVLDFTLTFPPIKQGIEWHYPR